MTSRMERVAVGLAGGIRAVGLAALVALSMLLATCTSSAGAEPIAYPDLQLLPSADMSSVHRSADAGAGVTAQNATEEASLATDVSTSVTGERSVTTQTFTTAEAGEQLFAFVSANGPVGAETQSATVSGAGLKWRLVERADTQSGDAEIWTAEAKRQLKNKTVKSRLRSNGYDQQLTVISMRGSDGAGASGAGGADGGEPSVSLTTVRGGSLVYAVGSDWDSATARTVGAGQVLLSEDLDSTTGETFWSQFTGAVAGPAGSLVTMNDTAPTNDQWNMAAVEILASAPGQVTGVSATPGNESATVKWSAPADGGSPITSYTVTPFIGAAAQPVTTITGTPPTTSTTIDGLTNGTTYTFAVEASNSAGSGPASQQSDAVTPTTAVTLIGEETTFSTYQVDQNGAAILAWPFTAAKNGTIEAMHIYVLSPTAAIEGVELGIYENDTYSFAEPFEVYGKKSAFWEASGLARECPGTLLAARYLATGGHLTSKWVELPGFDVKITAGKQYWLAVLTHAAENGQDLVYGKKSGAKEAKPWGNYSNEWSLTRKMETLPPPPLVKKIKEPTAGWQQEEPAGRELQAGREAQEEGGPPSLYASGS
jgi:hypothetical protein